MTPFLLIIAIVMPGNTPDIQHRLPEPTLEQCELDAHEFLIAEKPKVEGSVAIAAMCRIDISGEKS